MPALDWAALRGRRGVDLTVWPPRYDPAYRPPPEAAPWLPEVECADPAARDALVLAQLTQQVRHAWERSAFYRRKWQEAGVSPAPLRSRDDLARFPVVQKAELRAAQAAAPPFGDYLCIEPAAVARIHCDRETFRPLPYGAEGTPVYTHLERTSQPMIRLVSGDRARWVDTPCPGGRTYPRLPDGLYGRFDDMIIVRGENIYPSAIDALRATMRERLRARFGVHPVLDRVPEGTLPRTEFKARRVIDDRDLYRPGAASCMSPGPNRESPTPRAKQFG